MRSSPVGQTDIRVTEVGFGCSGLGNLGRKVDDAECLAILERAWQFGIRYFDTAPHYGRGLSEARLKPFLAGKPRDSFVLSTKVGRLLSPGPALDQADGFIAPLPNAVRYDYSGDGIEASFEQSCARLGVSKIDIAFVHDIGTVTHGPQANSQHMHDLMTTGFDRLRHLRARGRIGAIGIGVNEVPVCLEILREVDLDVILLAGRLTLLDRSAEARLVPLCRDRGTSLVLGGIFNSGILALGPVPGAHYDYAPAPEHILDEVQRLEAEASAAGKTLPRAALEFAMTHGSTTAVLLGTSKLSSLDRNLRDVAAILGRA